MPRTVRDAKLETRNARSRLVAQSEPHWRAITEGCHLGYYKGPRGGSWIARYRGPDGGAYAKKRLGAADDITDADGEQILSYKQAFDLAQTWFVERREPVKTTPTSPYSVDHSADDYMDAYEAGQTRGGGKGKPETLATINAFIRPFLGPLIVSELTTAEIERWHRQLAATPPRKRSKAGGEQAYRDVAMDDPEVIRQRRASANRVLTVLKAILNRVPRAKHGGNEHAWADVAPFSEVDAPTIRWIETKEATRLLNGAVPDFRRLATGALLCGARYSELSRFAVIDFSAMGRGIHVRRAKGQKPRFIHLTDEGVRFFTEQCAGKGSERLIFTHEDGRPWNKSDQKRPIAEACMAARIEPRIGFHILRHSYGSWLAMRGVPLAVIARQLGHADTRMTERHYAHLSPSYVADTVRAAFGELGLAPETNIASMQPAAALALQNKSPIPDAAVDDVLHEAAEGLLATA